MQDETMPLNLPVMSNDPMDRILTMIRRYDPSYAYKKITSITDYPVADDYELLVHYLRGAAGAFVDLLLYVDVGVGWYLKPEGFSNSEAGEQAKDLVDEQIQKMEFPITVMQTGAFYETLGRACTIETHDLNGDYFYNKQMKVTGVDAINPMTLDPTSVRFAMADTTGTIPFKQVALTSDLKAVTIEIEQDRVNYITKNPMTKYSPVGNSDLQRCVTDLRTLARFPHYRNKLGRKYSELFRVIKIDSEKITRSGEAGRQMMDNLETAQKYLDDTAEFYRDQEEKGGTVAIYDWEEVADSSWGGKEVKLQDVELATLMSIAMKLGVPLPLLQFAEYVNRDTLTTLVDTFISRREKGTRNLVYTPLIERTANNILLQNGITEGVMKCQYNKFLSKNLVEMADIVTKIWPTQSMSRPEVRELMEMATEINMGGDEWEEQEISPMPSEPASNPNPFMPNEVVPGTVDKVISEMVRKNYIKTL